MWLFDDDRMNFLLQGRRTMNLAKLERFALAHPRLYKLQVGLLAVLGYGYLVLILSLFGGAIAFLLALIFYNPTTSEVWVQLLILLLIPIFLILRSLWEALTFKLPAPSGIILTPQTTPVLFQLLKKLTSALKCPAFDQVILTSQLNATVLQMPRFGIFGGYQNFLMIGLPLLQSLDVEQVFAVLAHELGHLSGNHSRFSGWVYRMRQTWQLILRRFSQGYSFLFTPFLNWYIPFFNAYSFVLARIDEYEADRCAVELAGQKATVSALVYTNLKTFSEAEFWQKIDRQVVQMSDPPPQPFNELGKILESPLVKEQQEQWLKQILAFQTNAEDTHPCLSDRLMALNVSLADVALHLEPIEQTAAVVLLGENLNKLIEQLNQNWQTAITFQWKEQYQEYQAKKRRLEILEAKALSDPLTIDDAWEQAHLTAQLKNEVEAIPLLELILFRKRDHAWANYLLGEILIHRSDENGLPYLERAMECDPDTILLGCQLLNQFYSLKGDETQALFYRQKAEKHQQEMALAEKERLQFQKSDRYQVPQLPEGVLNALGQQLSGYPEITTAYLVQRLVKYLPQKPCYILAIRRKPTKISDQALFDRLIKELNYPAYTVIVLLNHSNRGLGKKIQRTVTRPFYQA